VLWLQTEGDHDRKARRRAPSPERPPGRDGGSEHDGFVLVEVILALLLLVGAASVIVSGLHSAARNVERLTLEARAADLACTALAAVQMGMVPPASRDPEPVAGEEPGWTWELVVGEVDTAAVESVSSRGDSETVEDASLQRVEVIVRHGTTLTHRVAQFVLSRQAPFVEESGAGAVPDFSPFELLEERRLEDSANEVWRQR
jgi:hypothetical protein